MKLNLFSGRTFNDASQYYIFPWIIQDYNSNELDLSKKEVYRNLTLPIGAQNQERFESNCQERYDALNYDFINS